MLDFRAIADTGETLVKLLRNNMQSMSNDHSIVLASPGEIGNTNVRISIFLYQIVENIHLKNEKMQIENTTTLKSPPIALDLYYMITSHTIPSNEIDIHNIRQSYENLGRIIQILNDNPILPGSILQESLAGNEEEIHVILTSMSLDDATKIWTTFQGRSFIPSVCCIVTPIMINSNNEIIEQRVISKDTGYNRILPK